MAIRENFSYTDMDEWLNAKRVTEIECLVPIRQGLGFHARPKLGLVGRLISNEDLRVSGRVRRPDVIPGLQVGRTPRRKQPNFEMTERLQISRVWNSVPVVVAHAGVTPPPHRRTNVNPLSRRAQKLLFLVDGAPRRSRWSWVVRAESNPGDY